MYVRRPRLDPTAYLGRRRYFLTFCTYRRTRAFRSPSTVEPVLRQFLRTGQSAGCAFIAYCFMPDHVHLIVEATRADTDLTRWVKHAKQQSGYWFRRQHARRLWQPSWYDHVFREDDDLRQYIRYVLDNPVRAGLAGCARDYPFTGSGVVSREELFDLAEWA